MVTKDLLWQPSCHQDVKVSNRSVVEVSDSGIFQITFNKSHILMDSSDEELPEAILKAADEVNSDLLPSKSRERYEQQYNHFLNWCKEKGVNSFREEVFLAYFSELSKVLKSNTLWSRYSMVKRLVKIKQNLDISKFHKLTSFLKKQNVGFRPQKAQIFTKEDISKFMLAPDEIYLMIKVGTIFALAGALRRAELVKITLDDIQDKGNLIIVKISDSKNHTSRSFVISEDINNGTFLKLYRKYANLRPPTTTHRRFFINYKKGKCSVQCVGINTFGKMPAEIASYLGLPNPERYTGHSFRRSSATFLADSGEGITNIKRLGGWKSTAVAEGYLEDSVEQKKTISNKILSGTGNLQPMPSPSSSCTLQSTSVTLKSQLPPTNYSGPAILTHLQNATNCVFNININSK